MTKSNSMNFYLYKNQNMDPAFKKHACVILKKTYNDESEPYTEFLTKNRAYYIIECGFLPRYYKNGEFVEDPNERTEWCRLQFIGPDITEYCDDGYVKAEDLDETNQYHCLNCQTYLPPQRNWPSEEI